MKPNSKTIILTATLSLLTSCSTLKSYPIIGGSIGASVGALSGTMIGSQYRKPITGSLVGASTGALLGILTGSLLIPNEKKVEQVPTQKELTLNITDTPSILKPEVKRINVPDKIEGNKYIKSHDVYILEKGTSWGME